MRRHRFGWLLAPVLFSLATQALAAEASRIGREIDDFSLKSQFGKEYALSDLSDSEAVVVVFLGAECPLAKLYGPRLARLADKYAEQNVAFVGVDSNRQDSIQEIAAYAHRHKINFPVLKDTGNEVADAFGAIRTPEVFVLDKNRVVRYWGRVDDQYGFADGVGYQRPSATRHDLVEAIDEILAGKDVSVATTEALGCHIGRLRDVNPDSEVTYSNQVARVLQARCVECHRAGRIGPFEMTSYDEVAGWGEMIAEVVEQERMPPWHADPAHGEFENDVRLSDEEKQLIYTWVQNGCPEGDPAQLPEPVEYTEGWTIGEPDQIVYMSDEQFDVPSEGVVDYQHYVVDPGWDEDKWITAAEAKPESLETVHHILVFVQPKDSGGGGIGGGGLLAGYAPGANPILLPGDGVAMKVPAGSKLYFQLHYTPTGEPAKDRSYCGFKFADEKDVKFEARSSAAANGFFKIPAGDNNYQATAKTVFERDTLIDNLTPHMHTRGKSFKYEVTYPDGTKEVLLDVPSYDFNWQTTYFLKEPKLLPKGTEMLCTAHWDNSEENLSNPDPTIDVSWGDQSFEEMMIGFYVELYPKGEVSRQQRRGGFGSPEPAQIIKMLDKNDDGLLTKEELPERFADRLGAADKDGDDAVSESELKAFFEQFRGGRGEGRGRRGRRQRDDSDDEKSDSDE